MKKVIYTKYGNFNDLEIIDIEKPEIQANEILVKVKAVAINPLDWKKLEGQMKIITGNKFPKGIAFDFSGIIEKIGSDVHNFKVGEAVFGALDAMKGEALAEYLVVKPELIYKKPESITFETAAGMLSVGAAAIYLFNEAYLEKGSEILINGASGAVGTFALQMAKKKGINVTAVASGQGLAFIKKWNPEKTIDYKKEEVQNRDQQYNAIFELGGSLPFSKAKNMLYANSKYISTLPNPVDMLKGFFNNIFSSKKNIMVQAKPNQDIYKELCYWVNDEKLEVPIAKTFAMAEFKQAYEFAKKGGIVGKVVFSMG